MTAASDARGERDWNVGDALSWTVDYLTRKEVDAPRRSAEWLLSAATGLSRIELYAHFDRPLTAEERAGFRSGIERRAAGEPLQYVTGEVAFRHIVLKVRQGVLIPRPETEVVTGELLAAIESAENPLVADVCTGSGCIALSIANECPGARVWACDISPLAVEVAAENAERLCLTERVSVYEGDLLGALPAELEGTLDAVISNPPYIPSADVPDLPAEVSGFEPHLALDGGPDGLDVFRRLAPQAASWLKPGGVFVVELDERRVETAATEAVEWYEHVRVVTDLAGRNRAVIASKRG